MIFYVIKELAAHAQAYIICSFIIIEIFSKFSFLKNHFLDKKRIKKHLKLKIVNKELQMIKNAKMKKKTKTRISMCLHITKLNEEKKDYATSKCM